MEIRRCVCNNATGKHRTQIIATPHRRFSDHPITRFFKLLQSNRNHTQLLLTKSERLPGFGAISLNDSAVLQGRPVAPAFQSGTPGAATRSHKPLKVVAIGGGAGLSTLLKGLKQYILPHIDCGLEPAEPSGPMIGELTAVVTVTDDGGSSGRLRKEFKMLPPGDIRNCLVALSEDENLLSRLFQYRFTSGSGLEGHSFGNLFLAALTAITKDFGQSIRLSSAILATRGRILPSTTGDVQLCADMDDGTRVLGETSISASRRRIVRLHMSPPDAQPAPETLSAIAEADLITIGPGSLFTSLVPNLLVHGIPEAIAASSAVKVYVCNLMTQANESLGLTAADHIRALYRHARMPFLDYALVNKSPVSDDLVAKYALESSSPVVCDEQAMQDLGVRLVKGNYVAQGDVACHAADKVALDLLNLTSRYQFFIYAKRGLGHAVNR